MLAEMQKAAHNFCHETYLSGGDWLEVLMGRRAGISL